MSRPRVPDRFVRLSANYADDRRIIAAGLLGELLWVRGLAFARRLGTDGRIYAEQLDAVTRGMRPVEAKGALTAVVREGLWQACPGGYEVPPETWARWQITEEELDQASAHERERKAAWRARRKAEAVQLHLPVRLRDASVPGDATGQVPDRDATRRDKTRGDENMPFLRFPKPEAGPR